MGLASAQITNETRAKFEAYRTDSTVRVRPGGTTPDMSPADHGDMVSSGWESDLLWIAGNSQAWAHLSFWNSNNNVISPLVKVEGTNRDALYGFPCRAEQAGAVIWGFADIEAACDTVIAKNAVSERAVTSLKVDVQKLSNGSPAADQLEIAPLEKPTIIRVHNIDENLAVEILAGTAQVAAPLSSARELSAGSRYIQSSEGTQVESFDLNEAWDSPSMESYLDDANWSSDVNSLLEALNSAAPISSQPLSDAARQILNTHNQLRVEVGVPPMSWSSELASIAQSWANELSRTNSFEHSPISGGISGAGENIAAGSNVDLMLSLWANEKDNYDPSTGSCRPGTVCGHYTQMVWRGTTEVGCGVAPHGTYGQVMVCNYRPPGNYRGRPAY
ncbi:MAG: CAP domain-containing protein [Cyanobacteria bacterium P01_F01_bin.56]